MLLQYCSQCMRAHTWRMSMSRSLKAAVTAPMRFCLLEPSTETTVHSGSALLSMLMKLRPLTLLASCAVWHTCRWPLLALVRCCLREVHGTDALLHCCNALLASCAVWHTCKWALWELVR